LTLPLQTLQLIRHLFAKGGYQARFSCLFLCFWVLCASFFSGCGNTPETNQQETQVSQMLLHQITLTPLQESNIGLKTTAVHWIELVEEVGCSGQIQAATSLKAQVFPPVPGRVEIVSVSVGQFVQKGTILATLKSDVIGQLESDLLQQTLQNEADERQAKVQLEYSKSTYSRESELYREEVSSKADMEAARTQYKKDLENQKSIELRNQANIQAIKDRFSLYDVDSDVVSGDLKRKRITPYLQIKAPRSGLVIARNVNNGEIVDTSKEIFSLADLSTVWLAGNVYEKDVSRIKLNQPVTISLDSNPNLAFQGSLSFVSNILDPDTRTLEVIAQVANSNLYLKPNMFARMAIQVGKRRVLAVPESALEKIGDVTVVYVQVQPHLFEERQVTIGQRNAQFIEITKGLRENEIIVSQGTMAMKGIILKRLNVEKVE
jgi:membrane fusion protein, heavy metal efflux system